MRWARSKLNRRWLGSTARCPRDPMEIAVTAADAHELAMATATRRLRRMGSARDHPQLHTRGHRPRQSAPVYSNPCVLSLTACIDPVRPCSQPPPPVYWWALARGQSNTPLYDRIVSISLPRLPPVQFPRHCWSGCQFLALATALGIRPTELAVSRQGTSSLLGLSTTLSF